MSPHCQHCVQKKNSLLRPWLQASVVGDGAAKVSGKLLKNIYQGRGRLYPRLHRKAQTVCLSRLVVRVLSQNNHLGIRKTRVVKRVEDIIHIRENLPRAVFTNQKLPQFPIVGLSHFVF